jgi:RNA polymerase sigma-70 factor (ECF subfamily)
VRAAEQQADLHLVRRTLAGESEAFGALVEKYKDPVYSVAYRMMGNPTEAEDVAQDAFVRAYTQLHAYSDSHRFSTWLLSITSHLAIDQIRRRRFVAMPLEHVPFLDWIADGGHGPERQTLEAETSDEMQRILSKLPTKYRVVLLLRYWNDLSYDEIAETLHVSGALVKARLHRARVLVERIVRARGIELGAASAVFYESGRITPRLKAVL